jgi:hypothetical protein
VANRFGRLLSNVACVICASVLWVSAQDFGPGVPVPDTDQEAAELETSVKAQSLPPPDQLYQAEQAANSRVNGYQSFVSRTNQQKTSFENVRSGFPQVLDRAVEEGRTCAAGAKQRIMNLLNFQTLAFNDLFLQLDPSFREYLSEVSNLGTMPEKELCAKVVSQTERDQLQKLFNSAGQKYEAKMDVQIANAKKIEAAWQGQLQALVEQQKKVVEEQKKVQAGNRSTQQVLVQYLWAIILILCLFSGGILFSVRFFDKDVQMELIASGQVIQFPTVMMLLVVIISLGLTGILTENSLAALLGGLAGYVLSQGVGRAAARAAQQSKGPSLWVWPQQLTFTGQKIATSSASQTVTVTNIGNAPATPAISVSGEFSQTNTCNGPLAVGSSCEIKVTFTPTAAGTRNGSLTVSEGGAVQTVTLTGTGV